MKKMSFTISILLVSTTLFAQQTTPQTNPIQVPGLNNCYYQDFKPSDFNINSYGSKHPILGARKIFEVVPNGTYVRSFYIDNSTDPQLHSDLIYLLSTAERTRIFWDDSQSSPWAPTVKAIIAISSGRLQ